MKNIDVSVIIPIYNVKEYLSECLMSLLRQGDVELEVIMMDDGSTDGSGEIALQFAEKHENFQYYYIDNGGPSRARNLGVKHAKGKYIIYCDSDDIVQDNAYQRMYRLAEETDSEITVCNVKRFNSSKTWNSKLHKTAFRNYETVTHITRNYGLLYDTTSPTKMIRRDFYESNDLSFPEGIIYEDIPFSLKAYLLCNKCAMMKEIGYWWRSRDGETKSLTQNEDLLKNLDDRIKILRDLRVLYDNEKTGRDFALAEQFKILDIDLEFFIHRIDTVSDEDGYEIIDRINNYINDEINEVVFERLSVINKQKYEYTRKRNLAGLKELLNYKGYSSNPIIENNGRLYIDLPDNLFNISDRDVTAEFECSTPRVYIDDIEKKGGRFTVTGHLYWRRLSLNHGDQDFEIYLSDNIKRIELPARSAISTNLTTNFGRVISDINGSEAQYNYDGAGFSFDIDIDYLKLKKCENGLFHIEIEYKNRLCDGMEILKGCSHSLKDKYAGTRICGEDTSIELIFSNSDELFFNVNNESIFLENSFLNGSEIKLVLSREADILFAVEHDKYPEDRIKLEKIDSKTFAVDAFQLQKDRHYHFLTDKQNDIVLNQKKSGILSFDSIVAVLTSYKTNICILTIHDCITCIEKLTPSEGVVSIATSRYGDTSIINDIETARITVKSKTSRESVCLAVTKGCFSDGEMLKCEFDVNIINSSVKENLSKGRYDVFVEYIYDEGKKKVEQLFYGNSFSYKAEDKEIAARLYLGMYANVRLQISNK